MSDVPAGPAPGSNPAGGETTTEWGYRLGGSFWWTPNEAVARFVISKRKDGVAVRRTVVRGPWQEVDDD